MPAVAKQLAEELVQLRHSIHLAGDAVELKVPATLLESALQRHLDCEHEWAATLRRHVELTEAAG